MKKICDCTLRLIVDPEEMEEFLLKDKCRLIAGCRYGACKKVLFKSEEVNSDEMSFNINCFPDEHSALKLSRKYPSTLFKLYYFNDMFNSKGHLFVKGGKVIRKYTQRMPLIKKETLEEKEEKSEPARYDDDRGNSRNIANFA